MAVPDYLGYFDLGVLYVHLHCVHNFFNLYHSGTQFFLGNIDTVWNPKIR